MTPSRLQLVHSTVPEHPHVRSQILTHAERDLLGQLEIGVDRAPRGA